MTVTALRPEPVTILYRGTAPGTPAPVIVGTGNVWSDDTDATYAQSEAGQNHTGSKSSTPAAVFTGFPAGTISALSLTFRVSMTSAWDGRYTDVEVRVPPVTEVDTDAPYLDVVTVGAGIEEHTVSVPWDEWYRTAGMSVNFVAEGVFSFGTFYSATSTIYDIRLDVTHEGAPFVPPMRGGQRNDRFGSNRSNPSSRNGSLRGSGYL